MADILFNYINLNDNHKYTCIRHTPYIVKTANIEFFAYREKCINYDSSNDAVLYQHPEISYSNYTMCKAMQRYDEHSGI